MVLFDNIEQAEDRRDTPRFPVKTKAIYKGHNNCKCLGRTENISTTGALFNATQTVNADSISNGDIGSFAIMITENNQQVPIVVKCHIAQFNERGIGIQFDQVSNEINARLEQFIMSQL